MKFLVDAQLPRKLARLINELGGDAIHTLDLPDANQTPDSLVLDIAVQENRIVVSKDADFVNSFLLGQGPQRLLLISTGNIENRDLIDLVRRNWTNLVSSLNQGSFVELNRHTLILHE